MDNPKSEKKPLAERFKEEAREIVAIVIYLGIWLPTLATMKCLILLQYGINEFKNAYITAGISALVLAKVIAIGQNLPIANKMNHRPLFWACLYKAGFFTALTIAALRLEDKLAHHKVDPNMVFPFAGTVCHAIALFGIFFALFVYRDLDARLGKGSMRKLFFLPKSE